MRFPRLAFAILSCAALAAAESRAAWFVPVDPSPGPRLHPPIAHSADGRVIGGTCESPAGSGVTYPCLWTEAGGFERIGEDAMFGMGPQITGLSADGSVAVGALGGDLFTSGEAFRWTRDTGFVPLGMLSGGTISMSAALAVSADGSIVFGRSATALGSEVFRWTEGDGMQALGATAAALSASDDGATVAVITECQVNGSLSHCSAVWHPGTGWSQVPDPGFWAAGVSGDGSLVLGSSLTAWQPAAWTPAGGVSLLGPDPVWGAGLMFPGAAWSSSFEGFVVVGSDGSREETFLWNPLQGRRSLGNVLSVENGVQIDKCRFHRAQHISNDGSRVVTGGLCTEMPGATYFLVDLRPACQDGLDNDADGLFDLADDGCVNIYDTDERPDLGCGLGGPDLVIALPLLGLLRSLTGRRRRT